jgi:tetraacyldisaccharide 4'-kinase
MCQQFLHDAWWRLATQRQPRSFADFLACSALQAGAAVYGAAVGLRNAAYDRRLVRPHRLPCAVVSIGNLTVGGTGKTACTELVASKLLGRGRRIAILSRGYGGRLPRPYTLRWADGRLEVDGGSAARHDGAADEPQLLARHLPGVPVLVGPKRLATGRRAAEELRCDTVILDDGLQHRQLARDCEIILVHAGMPLDGWPLLPRGPMREPLGAAARADVIILTKADQARSSSSALQEQLKRINPSAAYVFAAHEPGTLTDAASGGTVPLRELPGKPVALVSSIGDPAGFEAGVHGLGASILWHQAYPDHHPFTPRDWDALRQRVAAGRPAAVLTTEKDWVRLAPHAEAAPAAAPVWVLGVRMVLLDGEADLDARLDRLRTG